MRIRIGKRFQGNLVFAICLAILPGCRDDNDSSSSRYVPDPLAADQWYLSGSAVDTGIVHINLPTVGYKGQGVLVAVVDNGIDVLHEDLRDNIGSGNYSYLSEEWGFGETADHGTAVAGIIAAAEGNGVGIRGIAPRTKIIGFNALRLSSISNMADALVREKERVWISNNSWGDINSWGEPLALKSLIEDALRDGVTQGRGGKGIIYVFAAGNGDGIRNDLPIDNVNYSGLVNNRYTVPVCATDERGKKASYSESGATLIVCAPSKGGTHGKGITTTDASGEHGYNPKIFPNDYPNWGYFSGFGGTSAATPIVTGVVALLLETNPSLTWRDVRIILARSARKNDALDIDWSVNGAGYHINHKYGFGLVDAMAAISLARNWTRVGTETNSEYDKVVAKEIPDGDGGRLESEIFVSEHLNIEFIDVFFDASDHPNLGDLEIILTSPQGTKSVLAEQHNEMFGLFHYRDWRFGTMRHLGESSRGNWKLTVIDRAAGGNGALSRWRLKIYGTPHNQDKLMLATPSIPVGGVLHNTRRSDIK